MNQKPENPFTPGDHVVKADDEDGSVVVVVEVLPPEKNTTAYGREMDGEAVNVAFSNMLDECPGNWREIHPAKLASYCDDQEIKIDTYKHTNLEVAENPFTPGDHVIKPDYDDPDVAMVVEVSDDDDWDVSIAFCHHLEEELGKETYTPPADLESFCDEAGIKSYSYNYADLSFEQQY